ncbi:saccharopine dehydrogenase C-terminal domain-containing protein [Cloacibacillus evryensis]|uniref:saccharopine dehydrogenase C-terminal domain-containing protein n=1 Tax=Cloacibacillus evryensis TaxID=508460 RepID=UPI0022E45968|nr:saccharopine dehydrogenase C-terminal domain-containing protein [Cloacibacillus evryensis]
MYVLKKVLVLGAGRIAKPCISYLMAKDYEVYVADISQENIERCIDGKKNGHALVGDVLPNLAKSIDDISPDIVICLLPQPCMAQAAKVCVDKGVDYVNPSYIKDEMRALDGPAKEKGVTLLCELGLDPGIDHMSASKTIEEIHENNGKVLSFKSWCGALPALAANNNPLGYKLSWAPSSLVHASRRDARIVRDGKVILWPNGETYAHAGLIEVKGLGWFEEYANADSTPYVKTYNMPEVKEVYRGTLRFPGWCEMICKMQDLGLYDDRKRSFKGKTYADVTRELVGVGKEENLKEALRSFLELENCSFVMMKLEWLGLLDETTVPIEYGDMYDFVECLYKDKLGFASGEEDLSVMMHRYVVEYPDRRVVKTSTLIDYGSSDTDFSVAKLTGLPPAIGAQLILEGKINKKGVISPTMPEVYEPELEELKKLGIEFKETEEAID